MEDPSENRTKISKGTSDRWISVREAVAEKGFCVDQRSDREDLPSDLDCIRLNMASSIQREKFCKMFGSVGLDQERNVYLYFPSPQSMPKEGEDLSMIDRSGNLMVSLSARSDKIITMIGHILDPSEIGFLFKPNTTK